jgi:hypothetical protein
VLSFARHDNNGRVLAPLASCMAVEAFWHMTAQNTQLNPPPASHKHDWTLLLHSIDSLTSTRRDGLVDIVAPAACLCLPPLHHMPAALLTRNPSKV